MSYSVFGLRIKAGHDLYKLFIMNDTKPEATTGFNMQKNVNSEIFIRG